MPSPSPAPAAAAADERVMSADLLHLAGRGSQPRARVTATSEEQPGAGLPPEVGVQGFAASLSSSPSRRRAPFSAGSALVADLGTSRVPLMGVRQGAGRVSRRRSHSFAGRSCRQPFAASISAPFFMRLPPRWFHRAFPVLPTLSVTFVPLLDQAKPKRLKEGHPLRASSARYPPRKVPS